MFGGILLRLRPNLARLRPNFGDSGRCWPNFGDRPNLIRCAPTRNGLNQVWAISSGLSSVSGSIGPNSTRVWALFGCVCVCVARSGSNFDAVVTCAQHVSLQSFRKAVAPPRRRFSCTARLHHSGVEAPYRRLVRTPTARSKVGPNRSKSDRKSGRHRSELGRNHSGCARARLYPN